MMRIAIGVIVLMASAALADSEKWYPAQTILEPTVLPDYWGISHDIHGDLIYLGKISDRSGPQQQMGQIYRRSGDNWTLEQELTIEAPHSFHLVLGRIQADMCIVVGRYCQPVEEPNDDPWSIFARAHAFRYDGHRWNHIQELVAPDGALGWDLGLDLVSNVCVIGGIGCAHVFRYDGQRWNYEQKLTTGGESPMNSVAVHGNRVVTTVPDEKSADGRIGAAYFFTYDGIQWQSDGKLSGLSPYLGIYDTFWISAAMDGEWCILGITWCGSSNSLPGKAFIYRKTDRWRVYQELMPYRPDDVSFGASVFIQDGVCGTNAWDASWDNCYVSLYSFNGSIWTPNGRVNLPIPDHEVVWNFAEFNDGQLLVGASALILGPNGFKDGIASAAVFRACPAADLTNDCRVDLADFAALAGEWMK